MFNKFVFLSLLIVTLFLIILLSLLIYLQITSLEIIASVITMIAFVFAVFTYMKDYKYRKNKDTYDYIDNIVNKKFIPLVYELNNRMKYFDNYFKLPIENQMKHKNTVREIHMFLADLNSKLENNMLNINIVKTYFNENFRNSLLSMYLHFDITFLNYPKEVDNLYKKFFNDFEEFEIERRKQNEFFVGYFNKHVKNDIKIEISGNKRTLNEWIIYTNLEDGDCSKKEEKLHVLHTLKNIYSKNAGLCLSLGNLYHSCYKDDKRSIIFLEKAIKLEPELIESYLSLTAVTFLKTKNIDEVLRIYEKMPEKVYNDNRLIKNKSVFYAELGLFDDALKIADTITEINLKNPLINMINDKMNKSTLQ